jgi:hypothetical protein
MFFSPQRRFPATHGQQNAFPTESTTLARIVARPACGVKGKCHKM